MGAPWVQMHQRMELMDEKQKLYHYTGQFGFLGIIQSAGVWASHTSFLNDSSECSHAFEIAKQMVEAILDYDDYLDVFAFTLSSTLQYAEPPSLFITSFSEKADLLSQWRGYCPGGAGMCVGFDAASIKAYCAENGYRFERCIYERDSLSDKIRKLIDDCWEMFPHPSLGRAEFARLSPKQSVNFSHDYRLSVTVGEHKDQAAGVINWFCEELAQLAPLYKNDGFHEEAEWRIVVKHPQTALKYRGGLSCLIPYVELNILQNKGTLQEIVVGPNPDQSRCLKSASMALETFGYQNVDLRWSFIPFNNW
ncbi:hypothetical protein CJF34_02910 [Pseudomonas lundensis]|nr:hypothetical protein CJF34_02910 [Pseudomonas lundensis]